MKITKISLEHSVIVGEALKTIMRVLGGDTYGFGYPYIEMPKGDINFFSVYNLLGITNIKTPSNPKGELGYSWKVEYLINPHVFCNDYSRKRSSEFSILTNSPYINIKLIEKRRVLKARLSKLSRAMN